jgi:DNA-binding response OmpR family regulator
LPAPAALPENNRNAMRLLVVENSPRLQRNLVSALRQTGYVVDVAGDGEVALWHAREHAYDAIVLDIMLPGRDGLDVLSTLRAEGRAVHVLLLTARDTLADRVRGLHLGADDYLVKPFALEELLARVAALCRRSGEKRVLSLTAGNLTVDPSARAATCGGQALDLTAREYLLLEYITRHVGVVVSRADIEGRIYDERVEPASNVVDSTVCNLRKKLAAAGADVAICTRRGFGYLLAPTKPTAP